MQCPNCGYNNGERVQICTRCGELLITAGATNIIDRDGNPDSSPKYGTVRIENDLIVSVLDTDLEFRFNTSTIDELIIGRRDESSDVVPDIDLSSENAIRKGVSRNHAMIVKRDNILHICDNDSSNGTLLNGQRLVASQMRVLRDGDDLQLGNLTLRITFE